MDKLTFHIPSEIQIVQEINKLKSEFYWADFENTREKTMYVDDFGRPVIFFITKAKGNKRRCMCFGVKVKNSW